MARIKVIRVGADKRDPFSISGDEYLQKTHALLKPEVICVAESKRRESTPDAQIKNEEGVKLLAASENCFRIALDERGKELTSEELAAQIEKILPNGRPIAFLIGGATGLSDEVKKQANLTWSLSKLTLPHRLAYCLLAEQIFRDGEILRGGPYHKR